MKAVLLGVAVLLIQIFVVGCYYTFLAVLAPRSAMRVWLASSVLLVLLAFVLIKSQCHECLTVPSVAQCQRSQAVVPAIDIELHSTRIGGYIVKRHFLGCDFYWHENDSEAGRSPSAKPGSAPSRYGLGGLRRRAGWSQRVGHNIVLLDWGTPPLSGRGYSGAMRNRYGAVTTQTCSSSKSLASLRLVAVQDREHEVHQEVQDEQRE